MLHRRERPQFAWSVLLYLLIAVVLQDTIIPDQLVSFVEAKDSWAEWGEWDQCDVTCGGGGTRARFRDCESPSGGFGFDCGDGDMLDIGTCGEQPCGGGGGGGGGRGPPPPPPPPPRNQAPPPPPPPPRFQPPPPPPPPPRFPPPPPPPPPPRFQPPPPPPPPRQPALPPAPPPWEPPPPPPPPPRQQPPPPPPPQPVYEDQMIDRFGGGQFEPAPPPPGGGGMMEPPGMESETFYDELNGFGGGMSFNDINTDYDNEFPLHGSTGSGPKMGMTKLYPVILLVALLLRTL